MKNPDWDLTQDNAPVVARILEATDGIPLCIELAAARVGSVALEELSKGLFDYLKRSEATAPDRRQASIEACLDWSFALLGDGEKDLLPKLSVFAGGFFPEDVEEVCEVKNAPEFLASLHAASLLTWEESLQKSRYGMLPTVRQYAGRKLGEDARKELRLRHSLHFLNVLDRADDQIRGRQQLAGIARISADLENIRAGMEAAIEAGEHRKVVTYARAFATYLGIKARFAEALMRAGQGLSAARALGDGTLIAGCQTNLGIAYGELPTGDRRENLKKAIACYEAALRVYTERDFPVDWATTQNNLGIAYRNLPTGDRGENLKKAIACYQAALRVYTERDFPVDWAMTQNNLGNAYSNLPTGDRGENLKKAIGCFEGALRVYAELDFPAQWAMTQNNLGIAYGELPTGDRGENFNKVIACYEAALRVYTERDFLGDWARIQNNLGNAYRNLPTGDPGENVKKAIACYEAAIRGFTATGLHDEAKRLARLVESLKR